MSEKFDKLQKHGTRHLIPSGEVKEDADMLNPERKIVDWHKVRRKCRVRKDSFLGRKKKKKLEYWLESLFPSMSYYESQIK